CQQHRRLNHAERRREGTIGGQYRTRTQSIEASTPRTLTLGRVVGYFCLHYNASFRLVFSQFFRRRA
ncbi:hypothetical protein, partial [Pseudomonas fluorescens]